MDTNNKNVQIRLFRKEVVTELSGDFSLPDYQPEIKRLLRIRPAVLPSDSYIGSGNVEISGNVDYYVLYIGSDGQLYCAPLTTEYSTAVQFDYTDVGNLICRADGWVDGIAGRVTAPRKLNIRCRLHTDVCISCEQSLDADGVGSSGAEVEMLPACSICAKSSVIIGDSLRVSDDQILDRSGGDIRVICAEGSVLVGEAVSGQGGVSCRGEIYLKLTTVRDDGESLPQISVRKLPFSQVLTLPGVNSNCSVSVHGCCTELSVEVGEGNIHSEVGIVLEAAVADNMTVSYAKDAYAVGVGSECVYRTVNANVCVGAVNGNFTIGESAAIEGTGIKPHDRVIDVDTSVKADGFTCERGRGILTGNAVFNILLLSEDGEYGSAEVTFPFRYETALSANAVDFDARMNVLSCRARIDGERIGIDAEVAVSAMFESPVTFEYVSELRLTDENTGSVSPSDIVICYPAPDDTLWSVAKRYGCSVEKISKGNKLRDSAPEQTVKTVKYLFI